MDMSKLKFFTNLTFILYLTSIASPVSAKGLGISSCNFYGFLKPYCNFTPIPIDKLPPCTAFLWDGLTVDVLPRIVRCAFTAGEEGALDQILGSKKPVYAYYGYESQQDWAEILECGTTDPEVCHAAEVKSLGDYMALHKGITGLVLTYLELNQNSKEIPKYSSNLVAYIKVLRKHFPELEIGMEIFGYSLILYYANPLITWLDFKVIDPSFDFYVITTFTFNDCTPDYIAAGTTPLNGDAPFTLTKVKDILLKVNVPTAKTYYSYRLSATATDKKMQFCELTYQLICLSPKVATKWCADTQTTFFEKGKFAKDFGAGFIAANVEFDDAENKCQCEQPFEAFYSVLNGFNGGAAPTPCPLMNRVQQ